MHVCALFWKMLCGGQIASEVDLKKATLHSFHLKVISFTAFVLASAHIFECVEVGN